MIKIDLNQAQERFGELLTLVPENGETILLEKSGKPVAAIISYAELKRLKDIEEDARDSEMMRRALEESENEEYSTPEEVIAAYNKIHGTNFTVENILNDPD